MKKKPKNKKELKKQIDELKELWKRAVADYQNLEKRIKVQRQEFVKFSNASLIDKLLAVLDILEKAQIHLKNDGLALAVSQFKSVLETEGVKEINAFKKKFNPQTMDCAQVVKGPENIVVKVVQKGYFLNDKILRPAKVEVGKGKDKLKN